MSFPNPRCLWCSEGYTHKYGPDNYFLTTCCNQFYHGTCKALNNWWLRPSQRVCTHCKTVNFGEPYNDNPKNKY